MSRSGQERGLHTEGTGVALKRQNSLEGENQEMKTEELCTLWGPHSAIAAPGRSPEIPDAKDAYGWFVGSWELDVRRYWSVDVSARELKGEVTPAWQVGRGKGWNSGNE